jgi:branched-chain amino acid transport system substrate-binding protein
VTAARPRGQYGLPLSGRSISIGIGAPLSGSSARLGTEMKQAAELAVEEWNAAGGLLGATVSAEAADDEGNTRKAEVVARGFCARPEVLGVVGHYNSDVMIGASAVYHRCGLAMITPIASNPAVTDRGLANIFRYTNRDDYTGRAIATHLHTALGKRRSVLVETACAYGRSMADRFAQSFTDLGGRILARHTVREGERDFRALVRGLPADFDLLFYGGSFEGAFLLRAMREAGVTQLFASGDGCWDVANFLEPAGLAATAGEGVLILAASAAVGRVPGSREFAGRYVRRYGPIINYALNSYDAARLLLAAIERAARAAGGIPGRADVVAAVRSVPFQGVAYSRPVAWDTKGDNTASVTVLNVVEGNRFHEVAEIGRDAPTADDARRSRPRNYPGATGPTVEDGV